MRGRKRKKEREEGVKDGPACESGSRANLQFCSRPLRLLLLSVLLLLLIHYHSTEGGGEWGRGGQSRTEAAGSQSDSGLHQHRVLQVFQHQLRIKDKYYF